MKLHRADTAGINLFTAYGDDYVAVNNQRYERSLVVLPRLVIPDWAPADFAALAAEHFELLLDKGLEVVLLGTGPTLRFPRPEIVRPLIEARLGYEVMDVQAACRTYNILVAEDRKVAAALVLA